MPLDEEHPSGSAFNKFDTKTLMGNWVEENALKAATGVSRVQVNGVRCSKPVVSLHWPAKLIEEVPKPYGPRIA